MPRPPSTTRDPIAGALTYELEAPGGRARLHVHQVTAARGLLVLGHSAAGGIGDAALRAAQSGAGAQGVSTVLVEQPYRVAGRRLPPPASQVDAAWLAVIEHLAAAAPELPLFSGGRSFGARVACRTAEPTNAAGVLCLAFPLHPPGRPGASRLEELDAVSAAVLVVQGDRDPFGCPPEADGRALVVLAGDHSLRQCLAGVERAVAGWLGTLLG